MTSITHPNQKRRDLMLMQHLNKTIDQLTVANSVHWNGNVLRRQDFQSLNDYYSLKGKTEWEVIKTWKRQKGSNP